MSKQQSDVPCHWKCQQSDPRRQILCACACLGQRHGEQWMADHKGREAREVHAYFADQLQRWAEWDKRSKRATHKIFSGLRAVG